jgi:Raf kinase inhibitor-like YbhB/YbcL family protein
MNNLMVIIMSAIALIKLNVTSPSFKPNDNIPTVYTCAGKNIHPALSIGNTPKGTRTFAIILEDPDATKGTFDHWVTWNIPPAETIDEAASVGIEGKNGGGTIGYTGPCPPAGTGVHHYHFHIYALDTQLDLPVGSSKQALQTAMKGHVLADGELIGLVQAN